MTITRSSAMAGRPSLSMPLPEAPEAALRPASPAASSHVHKSCGIEATNGRPTGLPWASSKGRFCREKSLLYFFPCLLVGHREHAVPTHRRLIKQIFLAALPVHARRSVSRETLQDRLKHLLRLFPASFAVEGPRLCETPQAFLQFRIPCFLFEFRHLPHQLVNRHRLQLTLDSDNIQLPEKESVAFYFAVGGLIHQDVRAVFLVQAFQPRRQVHRIAQRSVAVAQF